MTRLFAVFAVLAILAPAMVRGMNQAIHDQLNFDQYSNR